MSEKINYRKTTVAGMFWKLGERIGAQLVSTIVAILLARLLIPEDYGVIAITTIFITIANVFVTSGFGGALIQKKDTDDLDYSSVFYTSFVVSTILYLALFFAAPAIGRWFNEPLLPAVLRVIGLQLPISAIATVQSAYVSKNFLFRKFFWSTLIGTIISGIVGVLMAYLGYGVWALVAQNLTNLVIDRIILFITVNWRPKFCYSWKRTKSLFGYSWKLLGSSLLDTGYHELRSVIIGKKYSSTDLAFYNKGGSLPGLIGGNVNGPINAVLFPVMSAEQDDVSKVKQMTRRSIQVSCYIMFPLLAGLAVVAPVIVPVLFTEKWNECIPYMQMLCAVYAFWPVHTSNLQAIKALGRSDLFLILEIIKKVLGIAILLATMWFGVFWIVMGSVFATILSSIINAFPNRKLLKYSWLEQMKDLLPYIGLTLLMGVPVYAMNYLYSALGWNMYLVLVMQVVVGIILYVAFSFVFKVEVFRYLLETLKEFFKKRKGKKEIVTNENEETSINSEELKIKDEGNSMKKLLLLGGSRYLIPVIKEAHKLGLYVITCDYLPDNIAHKYSDEYHNVSIIDKDAVLSLAKKLKIDGIMSFACDPGVVTAAYVAEQLGLPSCGSYESVCILQNKSRFRKFLQENGFNVPWSKGYNNIEDALNDAISFHWPVIVKPVDSAGSKGVTRANKIEDLKNAIENALHFSLSKEVIIEDFIEKKGCSSDTDSFSVDGELKFVSFSSQRFDENSQNPYTPAAYSWPSTLSRENEEILRTEIQRVLNLLGMRTSIYNIETREGKDGKPYIMEISPRGGGNRLAEMLKYATGVDLIKRAVLAAIGEPVEVEQKPYGGCWAEVILHSDKPGIYQGLHIKLEPSAKIIEKDLWVEKGTKIGGFAGANEAIGTLVLRFDNEKEMNHYMENLKKYIQVKVK